MGAHSTHGEEDRPEYLEYETKDSIDFFGYHPRPHFFRSVPTTTFSRALRVEHAILALIALWHGGAHPASWPQALALALAPPNTPVALAQLSELADEIFVAAAAASPPDAVPFAADDDASSSPRRRRRCPMRYPSRRTTAQTRIIVCGEFEDIDFSNEEDVDGFLAAEAATPSRRRQRRGRLRRSGCGAPLRVPRRAAVAVLGARVRSPLRKMKTRLTRSVTRRRWTCGVGCAQNEPIAGEASCTAASFSSRLARCTTRTC